MNKTVKNSAIYFVGTIIISGLGFVNSMLLNHVLSQQVYAMYGLLNSFVTAVITLISFGYDHAYSRYYYSHGYTQKRFLFESLKVPVILFAIFAIVVLEPNRLLINRVFETDLSVFALVLMLLYVCFSFIHRFSHLTVRMEEYAGNYMGSNIIAKAGFVFIVLAVFFVCKNVTFSWILASFLISSAAAVLMNLYVIRKVANEVSVADTAVKNKELLRYGAPFMINNVVVLIIPLVEKIIVRDLTDWDVLSVFTAASIFQTVVLILTNTITNIWNPIVYKHCDDEKKFKPILHNFGFAMTIVTAVGLAVCILLRRYLVLLLNSDYYSVYIIVPSVLFTSCYHIVMIVYSVGININKKKTYHLIFSPILQAIVSIVLCYALIPKMELVGVAIASLASLVVSKTYRIFVGLKFYNTGTSEWKSWVLCIICLAFSVVSMFYHQKLIYDIIMALAIIVLTVLVVNKDFLSLYRSVLSLIKPQKKHTQES